MVFINRKKELEDIKKGVEGAEEVPAPPFRFQEPQAPFVAEAPAPRPARQFQPPHIQRQAEPPSAAPLFVKIDKYREVLQKLDRSKEEIKSLALLLSLLAELEDSRKKTEDAIKDHISAITDLLISLDDEFVQPEATEGYVRDRREVQTEVERYVSELKRELKYLKEELVKIG